MVVEVECADTLRPSRYNHAAEMLRLGDEVLTTEKDWNRRKFQACAKAGLFWWLVVCFPLTLTLSRGERE
jgi:hypothetical protein